MGLVKDIIKCVNVWKIFNQGQPSEVQALRGVDMSVKEGEMVSIMGSSGSGKSTLLNLIGALDRQTKGKVMIGGEDIRHMDNDQLVTLRRKKIGFVFQSFNLINELSAIKNVELPMVFDGVPPADRRKRATAILDSVGLEKKHDQKPNKLSGGENQRVAIARALANQPPLILADEPTGNLDSRSGENVMRIFENLNNEGKTIVIITHDQHVSKHTKRMMRLSDGKVVDG